MTWEEALGHLGVSASASAEEVRRAYLRLLKQHKPEVDPAGFARVREAFEVATGRLNFSALQAAVEAARARASGAQGPRTDEPAPQPRDGGGAPGVAPPEVDTHAADPVQPVIEALGALPDDAAWGTQADIIRAALVQHPSNPRLHWMLLDVVEGAPDEVIVGVLRNGHELDIEGFFVELLLRFPETVAVEQLASALDHRQANVRLFAAAELARRGDADPGLELLVEMCGTARTDLLREPPPTGPSLFLILRMTEAGALAQARSAAAAFRDFLRDTGQESRALREGAAATWTVVCELLWLPDSFPQELRAAVARAGVAGDISLAAQSASQWIAAHPGDASRVTMQLTGRAPNLARILGVWMPAPVTVSDATDGARNVLPILARVAGVVIFMSLSGGKYCSSSSSPSLPSSYIPSQVSLPIAPEPAAIEPVSLTLVREAEREACAGLVIGVPQAVCGEARVLVGAVRGRDCEGIRMSLERVEMFRSLKKGVRELNEIRRAGDNAMRDLCGTKGGP